MRLIDADALCMHLSDWQFGSMTDGKHDAEYEITEGCEVYTERRSE